MQRPPQQRGFQPPAVFLAIDGDQGDGVVQGAGFRRALLRQAAGQQEALDGIEPMVAPRVEIAREIRLQQVVVEEGLVLLVRQIGLDDFFEERGVFLGEEE